jgi:pimeloyl-ACP methyl ester carboxylesterase
MSGAVGSVARMNVILIPGLWLDASSWDSTLPALCEAGHQPIPLTMPGVGAPASESADIGIADWVDAVVAEIDRAEGDVVVVGHSGGGNVAWGAADKRPDRVSRVVLVDSITPPHGAEISEFDLVDGVVPFPSWDVFDEPDIADIDEPTRARIAADAQSVPAKVPTDGISLGDERRYAVPVTILSGQMTKEIMTEVLSQWPKFGAEFGAIEDTTVVRLDSGHWPQFSQPEKFAKALVDAIG